MKVNFYVGWGGGGVEGGGTWHSYCILFVLLPV